MGVLYILLLDIMDYIHIYHHLSICPINVYPVYIYYQEQPFKSRNELHTVPDSGATASSGENTGF